MSSCKAGVYYMYVTGVSVRNLQAFQVLQQVFLKVNTQEDYVVADSMYGHPWKSIHVFMFKRTVVKSINRLGCLDNGLIFVCVGYL